MFSTLKGILFVFTFSAAGAMFVSCETTPSAAPETKKIEYSVPIFDYEQGTTALQKKDGVVISLVPTPVQVKRMIKYEDRNRRGRNFFTDPESVIGHVDRAEIPYYVFDPLNLMFDIKINNQLDHILKMQGSIVTYNIDGKVVNVLQSSYLEFVNSLIPRRQEKETKIEGPPISSLKGLSGIISISIDEVPVEVDQAGKTTKTTNFEWIINYRPKKEAKEEAIIIKDVPIRQ